MDTGIVLGLMCLVVAVKGLTSVWFGRKQLEYREVEAEEALVLQRSESVEASKLQLEHEKQGLDREEGNLEKEKDRLCSEIRKLGVGPVSAPELPTAEEDADSVADSETPQGQGDSEGDLPSESREDESARNSSEPVASKKRILVVDDHDELRELLHQILSREFDVASATDGREALTMIAEEGQDFDVLVTDLKMPDVSGIALIEALPNRIPTIIISAFIHREEFREALKRLEPVAVIAKPFKHDEVRRALHKALNPEDPPE